MTRGDRRRRADRGLLLFRLADLIERDIELLATIEGFDVGRPAFEPRLVDLPNVVDVFRHFAGWADKIEGRWITPLPFLGQQRRRTRSASPSASSARSPPGTRRR